MVDYVNYTIPSKYAIALLWKDAEKRHIAVDQMKTWVLSFE